MEAIERLYPDRLAEQADRLAQHTLRGEVWDKAVAYWRQAGTRALARWANREAGTCFEQALAALQHLPAQRNTIEQAVDLRFDLRNALVGAGNTSASSTSCERLRPWSRPWTIDVGSDRSPPFSRSSIR